MKFSRRQFVAGVTASVAAYSVFKLHPQFSALFVGPKKSPREILNWHKQHFLSRYSQLKASEVAFIENVITLSETDGYHMENDIFYSGFSFSHRVSPQQMDSNRLAIGSFTHKAQVQKYAQAIFADYGISPTEFAPLENLFGMGWDLSTGLLKPYWLIPDLNDGNFAFVREGFPSIPWHNYRQFGLLSASYLGAQRVEKKIYLPLTAEALQKEKQNYAFADDIIHINHMITDQRGVISQIDLRSGTLPNTLDPKALALLEKYQELHLQVDTISINGPDQQTLYFG